MDGLSHFLTTILSSTLDRIGVTETGQKTDRQCGWDIFETAVITAVNHDAGTAPVKNSKACSS